VATVPVVVGAVGLAAPGAVAVALGVAGAFGSAVVGPPGVVAVVATARGSFTSLI
jgi:hypothetical protein